MPVRFYNTMTRRIEEFVPLKKGEVSLYTCGPTVYNYPHIGNLRTFVFEDLLHRWLEYQGFIIHHVMNLTDVDDKTIKNSIKEKMTLRDYTDIYKKAFFEDINRLNFRKAENYPAATDYIPEVIEMIEMLLNKGFAYETEDGVYFKVSEFKNYGLLSHIERDSLKTGASGRMSGDEYSKDEAADFALWKKWNPDDGDVKWSAPFGEGRPGWHIECSVMSMKLLGETIDIHCGGIDNLFPHHENEIAQSEAYTGEKFVNYWMHAVHLVVDGEKMAKSKGNFYTLKNLAEKGFSARTVRYALLTTHYRKPLNFSFDLLKQAESSLKRIDDFLFVLKNIKKDKAEDESLSVIFNELADKFEESLNEDLNISEAMAALFDIINLYYENIERVTVRNAEEALEYFNKIDAVLGFIKTDKTDEIGEEEKSLIEERTKAKQNKNYKRADEIRNLLLSKGIELRDTKDGIVWKRVEK